MTSPLAGPVIYELNTAAWLHSIAHRLGRATVSLGEVPDDEWDRVTPTGVDVVWLMGVWERSPTGREIALQDQANLTAFRAALVDLDVDADVIGSAYCVRRYEVDARFGGREGLAAARGALAERGARLLADFVPNHVAFDHPWLAEHPQYFVRGTETDLEADPTSFHRVGEEVIACGRDPFFPAWRDVAQLNAFDAGLRRAAVETLIDIGVQADGVRCDMAMLLLNDVFARTWGQRAGSPPPAEYWADVIRAVRAAHPRMLFVAEAYWDLEWQLLQLGFDHCYDKRLYDRLVHETPAAVRNHLDADVEYERGMVRFIENHDEPRAASTFEHERERAAAVTIATLPGATLWHEGQFEGWTVRLPVFLGRRPVEPDDEVLRHFHLRLLAAAAELRDGTWSRCGAGGWPDNQSCEQLLCWCWTGATSRCLVVVNDAAAPASARVHVPWSDVGRMSWRLVDLLSGVEYIRDGAEVAADGLFVELPAWGFHVLAWTATS